jgi:predicted transposase YbfD/YdcC
MVRLELDGAIVTIDAIGCQKITWMIIDTGVDCVIQVEGDRKYFMATNLLNMNNSPRQVVFIFRVEYNMLDEIEGGEAGHFVECSPVGMASA